MVNDIEKRNELVVKHLYLAEKAARIYSDSVIDYEERKAICYEGLLKCLNTLNINEVHDLEKFLFVSIKNFLFDELHRNLHYKYNESLDESDYLKYPDIKNFEDDYVNKNMIIQSLRKLSPVQRNIIILNILGDMNQETYTKKEVAKIMKLSLSTVKRQEKQGLYELRREYEAK